MKDLFAFARLLENYFCNFIYFPRTFSLDNDLSQNTRQILNIQNPFYKIKLTYNYIDDHKITSAQLIACDQDEPPKSSRRMPRDDPTMTVENP